MDSGSSTDSGIEPSAQGTGQVRPVRVEPGRRAVAFMIDVAACYAVGVLASLIPFLNQFMNMQVTLVLALVCRDYFWQGRGVGKNLMGLKIVDMDTGLPPTLTQSALRNIPLVAPWVVTTVMTTLLRFVPVPWINEAVMNLIYGLGMIYTAVVIPMEAYRVYSRADGLRIGDELAGTAEIESEMDFSNFIPRQ